MSTVITIEFDLEDMPLLSTMPDPVSTIRTMVKHSYSIFASQHQTETSIVMVDKVNRACEKLLRTTESLTSEQRRGSTVVSELIATLSSTQRTTIGELKQTIQALQEKHTHSFAVLESLPLLLSKSKKKGEIGEISLLSYLSETLNETDYTIDDVSAKHHSGDILITKRDFRILCDSKNYTKSVPKSEIIKLKCDMHVRNVRCGMLVSFDSGITGYSATDIDFYINDSGQLCCIALLGKVKDCPAKINVCIQFLETIWRRMVLNPIDAKSAIQEVAKNDLEDILDKTSELHDLIREYAKQKATIEASLTSFQTMLLRQITAYTTRVEERLRKFL
jgi:hypothetical protein